METKFSPAALRESQGTILKNILSLQSILFQTKFANRIAAEMFGKKSKYDHHPKYSKNYKKLKEKKTLNHDLRRERSGRDETQEIPAKQGRDIIEEVTNSVDITQKIRCNLETETQTK